MTENQDLRHQTISHITQVTGQLIWLGSKRFAQQLAVYGLTPPQYFTLFSLWHQDKACPMHALAEATYQDAATVTGVVNRLVKLGYVRRHRGQDDRRKVYVVLSEAGWRVVKEVGDGRHEIWRRSFTDLSQTELDQMLRILQTIIHTLQSVPETVEITNY
jgi:DNA-binding MarR family transcriptional regulator